MYHQSIINISIGINKFNIDRAIENIYHSKTLAS